MKPKITLIRNLILFVRLAIHHHTPLHLWRQAWLECRAVHETAVRRELNALTMEGEIVRRIDADRSPVFFGDKEKVGQIVRKRLNKRNYEIQ